MQPVPVALRQRYLLRSKQGARDRVRIVPELRRTVRFAAPEFDGDALQRR